MTAKRLVFAFFTLPFLLLPLSAFAQENASDALEPEATLTEDVNNAELNSTSSDIPVLEQESDKGIYKVQLRWPTVVVDPQDAIQIELVFLNASAPEPSSATVPQREGNATGSGTEAGLTVPGSETDEPLPTPIEHTLPIESYDIAVYSSDGAELWKQVDQPGAGGRGTQRLTLGNYTGPVTIEVTDIKPAFEVRGTTTASGDMIDSVTFNVTVVPEFPAIAVLPLAIGIAAAIMTAHRLRPGRVM
jgi:hypothetical protein